MPLGLWNLEWLNLNSQRKYPIAEDATGVSTTADFTIPSDFIVELDLAVHAGLDVAPGQFFVLNIGAYATGYSVVIGYQPVDLSAPIPVATALIARPLHTRNKVYALGGIAPFDDTVGKIVIGRLEAIDDQPPGFHTFDLDGGRLDPDAIRPIIRGVSAIILNNRGQLSPPLYGDVELVAGTNVQLVPIFVSGQDPKIRINAISGEGTIDECVCTGEDQTSTPIKSIDGIGPTAAGDFTIIGNSCLEVKPIANGIQLVDTCSQPCCGCPELETITRDLERLQSEALSVSDFVNRLDTAISTFDSIILGSRLSDRSCITC